LSVFDSEAFLLRAVPYGEADVIATFLTRAHGKIGAIARGARRSKKRFPGVLEPLSTVTVRVDDRGRDLGTLKEGRIVVARPRITEDLDALDAAGKALRFARELCPAKTPEPEVFAALTDLLDALDAKRHAKHALVRFSFALLAGVGYGLELSRCVRCGKPRPRERSAYLDAAKGGVVCSSCGGGPYVLTASLADAAERLTAGEDVELDAAHCETLLRVAEDAIAAHSGVAV
jgi:DNA repair protein RecO (recombination protein O)